MRKMAEKGREPWYWAGTGLGSEPPAETLLQEIFAPRSTTPPIAR